MVIAEQAAKRTRASRQQEQDDTDPDAMLRELLGGTATSAVPMITSGHTDAMTGTVSSASSAGRTVTDTAQASLIAPPPKRVLRKDRVANASAASTEASSSSSAGSVSASAAPSVGAARGNATAAAVSALLHPAPLRAHSDDGSDEDDDAALRRILNGLS